MKQVVDVKLTKGTGRYVAYIKIQFRLYIPLNPSSSKAHQVFVIKVPYPKGNLPMKQNLPKFMQLQLCAYEVDEFENKNSDFSIHLLKPLHRQKIKEKNFLSRNRVDRFQGDCLLRIVSLEKAKPGGFPILAYTRRLLRKGLFFFFRLQIYV